jgi:hypothetical protein
VEKVKKPYKIFYNPLEGSASLAVYWFPGSYGVGIEPKEMNGVYFTFPNGELLGVQFDDVNELQDEQWMTTKAGTKVHVITKSGKVKVKVETKKNKVA